MNKYPREDRHPWAEENSSVLDNPADNSNAIPSVGFPSAKGKRHWTVDRRRSHRQGRDAKYWQVPE